MLFNLFFVAGLCIYGFFRPAVLRIFRHKSLLSLFCFVYWALTAMAVASNSEVVYLVATGLATIITGILGGAAYFAVYALIPKWWRGRVIAAGVGGGTLLQYLVDFPRLFLSNPASSYFYVGAFFLAVTGVFWLLLDESVLQEDVTVEPHTVVESDSQSRLLILLIAAVTILCYLSSLYEGAATLVYPSEVDNLYLVIILKNTRLLYVASVIAAGFVADLKGRQYLPLISVMVMTILIFDLFLLNFPTIKILNWVILFIGAGFLCMFVTLNFIDIAAQTKNPALWAGGGRIIKHTVTAFGSVLGAYFWSTSVTGMFIMLIQYLVLLVVLIFLLFKHYQLLTQKTSAVDVVDAFSLISCTNERELESEPIEPAQYDLSSQIERYNLTEREKQVLTFVLSGSQIKEIAKELYITERTVKFHITNILTKTGTKNQKELISTLLYSNSSISNYNELTSRRNLQVKL